MSARRGRPVWQIAAGILVSLGFVGLALYRVDLPKLLQTFAGLDPLWLLAAVGMILMSFSFRALLWKQLLAQHPVRTWNLFRIITLGYFVNNLLPLKVGEVVRAWLLSRQEQLTTSLGLATVVLERGIDLLILLVLFGVMMAFVPFEPWLKWSGLALAGFALVFFLLILLNYRFGGHWLDFLERPLMRLPGKVGQWVHQQMGNFLEGLKLVQHPGQVIRALCFGALTWLSWVGVAYACMAAAHLSLPLAAPFFLIVVLNFGLMLPSSPGGLGVFEVMVILALTPYGVGKELALGVGFTFHMLNYFVTFVLGWPFALQMNLSLSKVTQEASE